ncbi:hypothetical protein BCV69DRAFT_282647 [Microstroma glucosiphilum]|uniref:Palmitoyltransferase n=1 Tax=Pseudomicrostroma glucosiphilum TaxID=1684307 RepID=A0A316U7D9_9BASI|nr:hypothetical protein BCV69DRAFT_282647 [Pseudomicrostroma glucosiphilum]PWN21149.1 hypothetical protein BCV69DRAFT_282647 [Pseudomicrostroma glucosiphilum]
MPSLSLLPLLANCVNRSFRKVEKAADWLVGKAGPFFIAICIGLVSIGAWTFFTLLLPSVLTPASESAFSLPTIASACLALYCFNLIYSIAWYYYAACTIPPGGVSSFVSAAADLAYDQASRQETDQDDAQASLRTGYLSNLDSHWTSYADRARLASRWVSDAHDPSIEAYLDHERNVRGKTEEEIEEEDLWPRVKMCQKCEKVPLWWALACLPEELRDVEKQRRSRNGDFDAGIEQDSKQQPLQDDRPSPKSSSSTSITLSPWERTAVQPLRQSILAWLPASTADTLVPPPKPERAHHCSVCKTCIIKFDHHCPWLNQCVGLYNERYFVGFLVYMVLGTSIVLVVGWPKAWEALRLWERWPYKTAPRLFVLLTYILCLAMGVALLVMLASHLDMISRNLTSVESSDRQFYIGRAQMRQKEREVQRKAASKATGRGSADAETPEEKKRLKDAQALELERAWGNVYDLGTRTRNLAIFFNVGEGSSLASSSYPSSSSSLPEPTAPPARLTRRPRPRPVYYSLLPVRYPPHSDGWHWPKRRGTGGRAMLGVGLEEEVEFSGGEEEQEEQETPREETSTKGGKGKKKKKGKGAAAGAASGSASEEQRRDEEREVLAGRTFDGSEAGLDMQ